MPELLTGQRSSCAISSDAAPASIIVDGKWEKGLMVGTQARSAFVVETTRSALHRV
jgi:hypothetical protein